VIKISTQITDGFPYEKIFLYFASVMVIILSFDAKIGFVLMFLFSVAVLVMRKSIELNSIGKNLLQQLLLLFAFGSISIYKPQLLFEEIFKVFVLLFICISIPRKNVNYSIVFNMLLIVFAVSVFLYPFLLHDDRFKSFLSHPNHLAYLCVLITLYFLNSEDSLKPYKIFFLAFLVVLSKSSGGMISFVALLFLYGARKNYRMAALSISSLVLFFLVWPLLREIELFSILTEKLNQFDMYEIFIKADNESFGSSGSFVWRLASWLALLNEFDFLSGYQKVFGAGIGTMSSGNYLFDWMITDPHNDYIRVLMERGILGGCAFYYVFFRLLKLSGDFWIFIPATLIPMMVGNILTSYSYILLLLLLILAMNQKKEAAPDGK